MILKNDNDNVIFLDANTDPYSNDNSYNNELAGALDAAYPNGAGYDVGHLYAGIGNNGNAGCIGCICVINNNIHKGSGFTTSANPIGDRWDIDYVAHEYGHQFGGNHTYSFRSEGGGIAQMEPGSGTTIMGYAGITGATDVQPVSDPYFHAASILQITDHAKTRNCDTETATGNAIPNVNAGNNITLPIGTAFRLTGTATDADASDVLNYCWEQFDENNGTDAYPDAATNNGDRPTFRSYNPNLTGIRTFPRLEDLLTSGVNGTTWEKTPTVSRVADFRLTVRDNAAGGAGNSFDDMRVTWDATKGPLAVTSQAVAGIVWNGGNTEAITWSVNSTNIMAGATNVNILLSTDGGLTYPTTLASNVPNNGAADIIVPSTPAPYCRIIVQPSNAPFFSINSNNFAIDYLIDTDCSETYTSNPNFSIPDNSGAYDGLGLDVAGSTATLGGDTTLKLSLDVTHTYVGDLQFLLQSPTGTQVIAYAANTCGGNDNLDIILFDSAPTIACATPTVGDAKTANPFSGFDGEGLNGQWILGVVDGAGGDTGTVNSWTLTVCTTTETALSTSEFELENFMVYPNPTSGKFNVKFNTLDDSEVKLFDIRGRSIYQEQFEAKGGKFNEQLNFSDLSKGIYVLNITSGDKNYVKKIVID